MPLDARWIAAWMREADRVVGEQRAALSALDREVGDGDHGENLRRGFDAVVAGLGDIDESGPCGVALRSVAATLMSQVGGAAGPLYGTALLRASSAVGDRLELDPPAVADLLEAALGGVVERGRAAVGDKSMVDAWAAAALAARESADGGASPELVLAAAADAAEGGARSTEPMVGRVGRAAYLGERAVGHRDPGAESTALLLRAAADSAAGV